MEIRPSVFFFIFFAKHADNFDSFHGSSKPGKRSFGRFSRPLLEVYFCSQNQCSIIAKSLAVAEVNPLLQGISAFIDRFCILEQKYKRGAVDGILSRKLKIHKTTPWSEMKISELFSPISDKGHEELTVLTIVQGIGTQPRNSVDRRIAYDKSTTNTYKRVCENDFILHLRSFEGGLEIANSEGIVSPAYTILRAKREIVPMFYYAYFRSYWFISNKLRIAVEGIRDGKSINMGTFWNITVPCPSIEEQLHIAEHLRRLDAKISKEEALLTRLQAIRGGLMQQLFI